MLQVGLDNGLGMGSRISHGLRSSENEEEVDLRALVELSVTDWTPLWKMPSLPRGKSARYCK